ncbi:peptidoglycan-binding domain-containing protein [Parenemella sanctibonifatiensis]|nr:peptidoglycan-binding protein [Parenemella sanctibonifatiensis]
MLKRVSTAALALISVMALTFGFAATSAQALNAWPVVKSGAKGVQVTTIQHLLGHARQTTDVDGSYGPNTKAKVIAFQKARGLSADGVVGAKTWGKLTPTLKRGADNKAVKALQVQLNRYGHKLDVDGKFGAGTEKAVRSFQSAKKLGVDGVVGPQTWQALIAGGTGGGGGGGGTSRAALAQDILNDSGITLYPLCGPSYAQPLANIRDTANGKTPRTGGGDVGTRYVTLNTSMLKFMRDYGKGNSYRVTTILGCNHSTNSAHYQGRAVDIDFANGQKINTTSAGRAMASKVRAACRAAGARSTLGPGDAGHSGHVHCAW